MIQTYTVKIKTDLLMEEILSAFPALQVPDIPVQPGNLKNNKSLFRFDYDGIILTVDSPVDLTALVKAHDPVVPSSTEIAQANRPSLISSAKDTLKLTEAEFRTLFGV